MELFTDTLFINLTHRTDRLSHILEQFDKLGISGERVDAIKTSSGAIGCTQSHIKCLEIAIERDFEQVFICEDDIDFLDVNLFKQNFVKFAQNKEISWDVIIIGGNNVPPYQQVTDYCARVFYCQTTTGYLVKKSYFNTLLQNFKLGLALLLQNPTRKSEFAIDMYWKRLQLQDYWYMITPPTVLQYQSYSDIECRNTDYTMMLDMEKEWYVKQQLALKMKKMKKMNI